MAAIESSTREFLEPLGVNLSKLESLSLGFANTFRDLGFHSTDQFMSTPVLSLPSGKERGQFLAIDVGGTNLRIAFIDLLGTEVSQSNASASSQNGHLPAQNIKKEFEKIWPIQEALKMDHPEDLFCWIGDCIAQVIIDFISFLLRSDSESEIPKEFSMGITFSFPMIQRSISEATLMPMGKGFAISSKQELGHLLLGGYEKHTLKLLRKVLAPLEDPRLTAQSRFPSLKIAAITNDAVATLASLSYVVRSEPVGRVAIGVILATGSNAAAPIKLSQLHKNKHPENCFGSIKISRDDVIVNTEWTLPGTTAPLRSWITEWDEIISKSAERPYFQPFEYMTSGRYLGELVRLIVISSIAAEGVQSDHLPELFCKRHALTTKFIGGLNSLDNSNIVKILSKDFPPPHPERWSWNTKTAVLMRSVTCAVAKRSAALFAAAIVGLLACTGQFLIQDIYREGQETKCQPASSVNHLASSGVIMDQLVVAYAGGVITNYPGYRQMCQHFIDYLSASETNVPQEKKRIVLREAPDGGIIGAGVVAGIAAASG